MTSASDDSSLSLDQDTNQFLISVGEDWTSDLVFKKN